MPEYDFKPEHMNATPEDFLGNNGIGRYVLLPGSDGRANEIAEQLDNVKIKPHHRAHNLYLGTLAHEGLNIDVAIMPTGMGCPSMEIILHELFHLGAKRFLRVGTAGSLQEQILIGDLVNAQGSVRDENTTTHYVPLEFPAVASYEMMAAILEASKRLELSAHIHTGVVHCKSSLYAREFGAGPQSKENEAYIRLLSETGILASEMETAALFIQAGVYDHMMRQLGKGPQFRVLSGAVLGIVATPSKSFDKSGMAVIAVENAVRVALETINVLAARELSEVNQGVGC